jgi:hypothetical protein
MAFNFRDEYIKCYNDKTRKYFIEHYLSTFSADEGREVPFKVFPRQYEFLKSICSNDNTIAIKHRQAGITTVSAAWATAQCVFAAKDAPETILCIGNKLDISEQLLEKLAYFIGQVPRWMWGNDFWSPDPNSDKNTKSIFKTRNKDKIELFNGCKVYARSSGPNAARGISAVSILIFDEAAFIENGPAVYSQAVAATASVKHAKIIMVSTPNGKDQLYYRTYEQALSHKNNYNAVEFKWFQDLRYQRNLKWSRKNEKTGEIEWDVDPVIGPNGEIPYDEDRWRRLEREGWLPESPWYNKMCKSFNNDEQKIAQELDVSFLGSSDNVIPVNVIEAHLRQNVIDITKLENWDLWDPFVKETWIWKDPIPGHRYVLGVDASSGSAEDRTAIEIIDIDAIDEETGMPYFDQVLEYYGKRTGDEIGEMVYNYATAFNNALVVVECIGGYGDAIILTLMAKRYKNIYYDDPGLKTYTVEKAYSTFNLKPGDKLPGFRTNAVRVQMIGNFVAMLKENAFRVRSTRVITEMDTWIWKNGRPDHMEGCHDDSLTCLAMTLFVIQFYVIKSDKDKALSKQILKSFRVNNLGKDNKPIAMEDNTPISNTRPMPFYTRGNIERQRQKQMVAMLMLAGFRKKE